jgi:hypothetical protein
LISDLKQALAFWVQDVDTIVKAKVEDEQRYQAGLGALFSSQDTPRILFEDISLPVTMS